MTISTIFIDFNSFFASVEQAEDSNLMNRPVAVVPMLIDTTSCIAASYPAKTFGIKTGTLVKDAKKLCPKIIFVKADHKKYVRYHNRILEVIEKCFPIWKVFSVDEMAIKLYGREQNLNFAVNKAEEIRQKIYKEIHPALTCSIGISSNSFLAKIASDMQKPNGLTIIHREDLPDRLHNLQLRDIPGIGNKMESRLKSAGCFSVRCLCEKSEEEMNKLWGSKLGNDFYHLLKGEDFPQKETSRSSIGHSRVLAPEYRTKELAWSHLIDLICKAASRLRLEGYFTKLLLLDLKIINNNVSSFGTFYSNYWSAKVKLLETQSTNVLLNEIYKLWQQIPSNIKILKISVTLSSLVQANYHQLSLWEDIAENNLMSAIDKINSKQSKNLIVYADSIELKKETSSPIAFSHIPRNK